jgi:hypothetical protein
MVRLSDTSGTQLLEVWFGHSIPGQNSTESYAKKAGSDTIYHAHTHPPLSLKPTPADGGPPMLDPHILPRALSRRRIVRITYAADGYPLKALYSVPATPASLSLPGQPTQGPIYEWYGFFKGEGKTLNISSALTYISFLSHLRYSELRDPWAAVDYGFDRVNRRLYLEDEGGAVDTLEVGDKEADGRVYLRNRTAGQVFTVASPKVDLLFPTAKALLDSLPKVSPYELAEPPGPQAFW